VADADAASMWVIAAKRIDPAIKYPTMSFMAGHPLSLRRLEP
jgi:hypothetical protein